MTPAFHRRAVAEAGRLPELRAALSQWLGGLGISSDQQDDIVLAGYEAMANSAEHAYHGRPAGMLDVHADVVRGQLTVTVVDYGTWRPPNAHSPLRGRGLLLIGKLADHTAQIQREDGTTVTMTWRT